MKNILIIGGNGYIGSRLQSFFKDNQSITTVDLNLFGEINNTSNNILLDYDKLDLDFISKFTHIILLAGHSSVRMCDLYPISVFNNNVRNFINLVDKINDNQTLIYAGSGSVYGNCKKEIADETYVFDEPHNMYDLTKQMIDQYYLTSKINKRIFGLRFGTVNGFSPHLRNDVMLNAMTYSGWKSNKVLLFNETTKRSILGIQDLVNAVQAIIDSNISYGGIYNLASFTKTSGEMAEIVTKKINCNLEKIIPEEIDTSKMNEKLVSSKYDFALSCDKFIKDFGFTFKETADSIIDELCANKDKMLFTNRNTPYKYM